MQLVTLERSQTTKMFWWGLGALLLVIAATTQQEDAAVNGAAFLLLVMAVMPFYLWLLGWSHGLPIWPVFVLMTGVTAALPMVQEPASLEGYSPAEIMTGGFTVTGFIILGTIAWLMVTARTGRSPATVLMIQKEHVDRYLLMFLFAGVFFELNRFTNWMGEFGNISQIIRGVSSSMATLSLFVLAYLAGKRELEKASFVIFCFGFAAILLMNSAGLMLAGSIVPIAMVSLGYALGGNRFPWKFLLPAFLFVALLHPGKGHMREVYWGPDAKPLGFFDLPGFYSEWIGYGLNELGGLAGVVDTKLREDDTSSVFERSGNLHMLLLVQRKSPDEVPFLGGITYQHIPRMLIPRFIDDQKGISHAGNVLLSVNYGLQTIEGTQSTSIYWGLIPEAYANYGYLGVASLAVVLAIFYGFITNLTVRVPMTSLRFVLGLLIMAAATRADTMGVFVTTQFQGVVGVSLAAMMLMRRQANPFAAEAANGGLQDYGTTGRGGLRPWLRGSRDERAKGLGEGKGTGDRSQESVVGETHTVNGIRQAEDGGVATPRDVGTGGAVRTMPIKMPKRIASWMPRRVRAAVVAEAARSAADDRTTGLQDGGEEGEGTGIRGQGTGEKQNRPRQVGVPYQNYRRYRG